MLLGVKRERCVSTCNILGDRFQDLNHYSHDENPLFDYRETRMGMDECNHWRRYCWGHAHFGEHGESNWWACYNYQNLAIHIYSCFLPPRGLEGEVLQMYGKVRVVVR